jgi:hypothetical protein
MDDIFVYFVPLPNKVHEAVTPCFGGYTIYINNKLDEESSIKAYNHALKHINNNDFEKNDVQQIEREAHYEEN